MSIKASGVEPGQRRLDGPQTTGRDYRSLSKAEFNIKRTNDVAISMRDGMKLLSDLFQPDVDERFPAVLSVSPSPRQIQDFGVPLGLLEAGASDIFVPRGYVQLCAGQAARRAHGHLWTSRSAMYFAMTQLTAAVTQPPHLKAIFPVAVTDDPYDATWHNGLLSSGFISSWMPAIGITAAKDPQMWRKPPPCLTRGLPRVP
jgi:predicted acyl esterase